MHDRVSLGRLPSWAADGGESLGDEVFLHREGIVVREGRRWSAVPWDSILTVVEVRDRALLCAPRRPPRAPWFELGSTSSARVVQAHNERRVARSTYRNTSTAERAVDLQRLLVRVLAREPIAGAIEVPVGRPPPSWMAPVVTSAVVGCTTLIGGALLTVPLLGVLGGAIAAVTSGAGVRAFAVRGHRRRPRVLVLTPDAFVGGLDGGAVRAIGWNEIEGFRSARDAEGESLEVVDRTERVVARVAARYFGVDVDVVVAVAIAYARAVSRA